MNNKYLKTIQKWCVYIQLQRVHSEISLLEPGRFMGRLWSKVSRILVLLVLLCTSACRSIKTTDTLKPGTPKGYIEIYSEPMRLCCGVKATISKIDDSKENVVGPAWEWNGGAPFEYHGRRIACPPGKAQFVVDLKSGGFGVAPFELRLGPMEVEVYQDRITPIRVTAIALPPTAPAEFGADIEKPQSADWSPTYKYNTYIPGQYRYGAIPKFQFYVIDLGIGGRQIIPVIPR